MTGKPATALETPIYMKNSNIYKFMRGATPIWEGVPPRPRDFGGGGVPLPPPPRLWIGGGGTRVTPSDHDDFHDFLNFLNF